MAIEQDKPESVPNVPTPTPGDQVLFKTKATCLRLSALLDFGRVIPGWFFTSYQVTPSVVRIREGFVSRRERDIPIRNIQDVSYSAGPMGRVLHYGTLNIESAGKSGTERLYKIQSAKKMRNVILEQMARQ